MSKDDIKRRVQECVRQMPQRDNVKKVLLFGSHLHGDERESSDVDLLIELRDTVGLFELVRMQDQFSTFLGRPVDLGQPDALSKYIRDDVLQEAEIIYEQK